MIPHPVSAQNVRELCRTELLATVEQERRAMALSVEILLKSPPVGKQLVIGLFAVARTLKSAILAPISTTA